MNENKERHQYNINNLLFILYLSETGRNMSEISIIVPVYNVEKYLENCKQNQY